MASLGEKTPLHRRKSWLGRIGIGSALIVLYVGSIGPLAGLEEQGYFRKRTWKSISLIYAPVLWSWKDGPDWWAALLSGYTGYFHTPQVCGPHLATYYLATHNEVQAYRIIRRMFESRGFREPELSLRIQEFNRRGY